MKLYGGPRCFLSVVSDTGRSQGSFVVGCGRAWREVRSATGSEIKVARHWRTGDANAWAVVLSKINNEADSVVYHKDSLVASSEMV